MKHTHIHTHHLSAHSGVFNFSIGNLSIMHSTLFWLFKRKKKKKKKRPRYIVLLLSMDSVDRFALFQFLFKILFTKCIKNALTQREEEEEEVKKHCRPFHSITLLEATNQLDIFRRIDFCNSNFLIHMHT